MTDFHHQRSDEEVERLRRENERLRRELVSVADDLSRVKYLADRGKARAASVAAGETWERLYALAVEAMEQ